MGDAERYHGARILISILKTWIAFLVVMVVACAGCALQDNLVAVNQRLISLKKRVSKQEKNAEALATEISRYNKEQEESVEASRSKHADLRALMNDLRDEIRSLQGQLEEIQHEAQQRMGAVTDTESRRDERLNDAEKSLQSSLDRIVRLEQYLGMEPSEKLGPQKPQQSETTREEPGQKAPEELYAQGKEKFDRGEYEAALELFQTLLKQHPKSEKADNAQFWIGEVYYREKWYEKAILEYQKVIESYPKGNKIRSALLKQGLAFLSLGDKENAKLILKELVRKYPGSSEAKTSREKLEKLQ